MTAAARRRRRKPRVAVHGSRRRWRATLIGFAWTSAVASAGSAQLFELPMATTTWGPLASRGDIGPGLIEWIAALLVVETAALALVLALLGRRIRRQEALRRGVPETVSWPSERGLLLEAKALRGVSWILAPVLGLLGALLGRGFTLWGVGVSGLLVFGALVILGLGAAGFVAEHREQLLLQSRSLTPARE